MRWRAPSATPWIRLWLQCKNPSKIPLKILSFLFPNSEPYLDKLKRGYMTKNVPLYHDGKLYSEALPETYFRITALSLPRIKFLKTARKLERIFQESWTNRFSCANDIKQILGWKRGNIRKSIKHNIFSQAQPKQKSFKQTSTNWRDAHPMHMAYKKIHPRKIYKKSNKFYPYLPQIVSKTIPWSEAPQAYL